MLADPIRRQVYASVVLGTAADMDVPAKKREKAQAALVASGLIVEAANGFEPSDTVF